MLPVEVKSRPQVSHQAQAKILADITWEWQSVGRTELRNELGRFVRVWYESDRNLLTLYKKYPELQERFTHGRIPTVLTRDGTRS
jgi:hypothetical protein